MGRPDADLAGCGDFAGRAARRGRAAGLTSGRGGSRRGLDAPLGEGGADGAAQGVDGLLGGVLGIGGRVEDLAPWTRPGGRSGSCR